MTEPFLSQISMFGFDFAPRGWSFCNGQTLPINQNTALFSLIGTTYGGNGVTTFMLPNLQGRTPIHTGTLNGFSAVLGQLSGATTVTLTAATIPTHTHTIPASSTDATLNSPIGNTLAKSNYPIYQTYNTPVAFPTGEPAGSAMSTVGGSQPHTNLQPHTVLNFCIAILGIFPSRN
jgi:microcystin-dependent protein